MATSIGSYTREETITDVLLIRLPVKSLLRFKCVCKSWSDLIKSASFIKKHFNCESSRPRLWICKFGVEYRPQPPLRAINFFLFPEKLIAGIIPASQRIFRWEGTSDFRGILGPINGLFMLEKGHFLCNVRFAWWNPATKKCRTIPMVSFELQRFFDEHECISGIGYDAMEGPPIPNDHWGTLMLRAGSLAAMSCSETAQPFTSCYDVWERIGEKNWIKIVTVNPPITWHWPIGTWEYDKLGSVWPISYKESLVPINRENPLEEDNIEYFFTTF
ncbi:hypothetical protein HAX54_001596 [Datura stramonium]|uniref:F-box domain-containing protein n=1 Tax=Datura stramonium TaxID=4076 RepID=A0ABS8T3M4_DATST|nr:hypothetical protein [Datura stramonium]